MHESGLGHKRIWVGVQSLNWVVLDYYNGTRWSGGSSPAEIESSKSDESSESDESSNSAELASQLSPVRQMPAGRDC